MGWCASAASAAIPGWLTSALPPFAIAHLNIALDVQETTADDILGLIKHDTVDVLLYRKPASVPDSHFFMSVLEDRFVVVARVGHLLAALAPLSDQLLAT